ncbi:TonB-dependent receptor [Massilibacteroides sp.]|uniref:SusC/RagA family TonB-linked outer membrane protein n=1 Tax=Massilibacteroides sp. TaxID=2034766 RepID=UPI002639750C|nr:TonB-dependent receptor [Massilibacteroides sp.]MDD4514716.1 TonB-dependent receptor [Massilibacteroides sp.]
MKIKTLLPPTIEWNKHIKDYFRIMKITITLLFVCMFQLMAYTGSAQNTVIKINSNSLSVKDLFNEIEKQTEYLVVFSDKDLDSNREIIVKNKSIEIGSLLATAFNDTDIEYLFENNYIVLKKKNSAETNVTTQVSQQSGRQIKGTVTDEKGEPIIGANVVEKGTTNGTITDMDGKFVLTISGSSPLVVSYIGYKERNVIVGQETMFNIKLAEDLQALEEVVVVGYGTQRAKDLTTSIANVAMKNVKSMPVSGLDQALTGQVAGVMINTSNGIPGGGPQIKVRGLGAVGAKSQPLYVIDGFPLPTNSDERSNPINDIPPQDIASITILKDASATAIYGSRGANGVILVTTQRGISGKPRIQATVYTGIQEVIPQEKPNMMNATEFAQFQKERLEDLGLEVPPLYQNPKALGKGTNWFEEITQIAPVNEINLSINGGGDKISSYASVGYFKQDGVVINTDFERISARVNVDAKLGERFSVGLNLAPTFTRKSRDMTGGNGREHEIGWAMTANPIAPVYNPDGSYNTMIGDETGTTWNYPNLVQSMKEINQRTKSQRLIASLFGEYSFFSDLKFKSSINIDWFGSNYTSFRPSTLGGLNQAPPTIPSSGYNQSNYLNWATENTLTYTKTIGSHSINGLLGFTYQTQKDEGANFSGNDYTSDEIETLNAAGRIGGWNSWINEWTLISYLARATYNYKQKYLLTAAIRRDGSSRFGEDSRWGTFPSVSLGWRLNEERFMQEAVWIDDLKIRGSYGLAGNFEIGNYTYMSEITKANYVLNGALAGGRRMNTIGNPCLGWEQVYEWNIGLDFSIFNDRFSFIADFYKRNTKNLLLDIELPASSGFKSAKENNGNLQNTGFEFSITSRNLRTENLLWTTSANIAFNKNKVISLGRDNTPILTGFSGEQNPTHITMVGKPLGLFYGYVVEGLYTQEDIDNPNVAKFPGAIAGNIKVKDIDGSGDITAVNDFDVIGDPYPDFTFGITNVLNYKQWDMRISMSGSVGGQLLKTQYEYTHNTDGIFNVTKDMVNRYRSEEQPGDGRTPTTSGSSRGRVIYRDVNSDWVIDNDYLWIKNITLGYNLDKGIKKICSNARFYVSIQNAFLITGYDGNPEITNYGNSGQKAGSMVPGVDYTGYPVARTYSLGINLTF